MPDFNNYVVRHGESWVQSIVEQIERKEGIIPATSNSLEDRWKRAMHFDATKNSVAA